MFSLRPQRAAELYGFKVKAGVGSWQIGRLRGAPGPGQVGIFANAPIMQSVLGRIRRPAFDEGPSTGRLLPWPR